MSKATIQAGSVKAKLSYEANFSIANKSSIPYNNNNNNNNNVLPRSTNKNLSQSMTGMSGLSESITISGQVILSSPKHQSSKPG